MRIVCAGDSLTRGVSYTRGRLRIVRENYPNMLETRLQAAYEGIKVKNAGAFHDTSDSLVKRLDKDVIAEHPDIVLLEIGANDCDFQWSEVSKEPDEVHVPNVPLDKYVANVGRVIREVRNAGSMPVVLTLLPIDPIRYYERLSSLFGKQISHWIAQCGGIEFWHNHYDAALRRCLVKLNIPRIDVRQNMKEVEFWRTLLSEDGIHLTSEGYKQLGRKILSTLDHLEILPKAWSTMS